MCEIIICGGGDGGGVDGLVQSAFCGQAVSLFAVFVHQPHVFGAFGSHHLTGLRLTVGVDFEDSLQEDKKEKLGFYHRLAAL